MRNLLNPRWLFVVNTFPSVLLLLFLWRDYAIVQSQLESHTIWAWLSGILLLLTAGNATYALYGISAKRAVTVGYSLVALPLYIGYLYAFAIYFDELIPRTIPNWMLSDSLLIYAGTFVMPTLMYALLVGVLWSSRWRLPLHRVGLNFALAVMVPVLAYVAYMLISPLWHWVDTRYATLVVVVSGTVGVVVFLFFVLRGVYQLSIQRGANWVKYQLVWKIPFALVFPVLGLVLHSSLGSMSFFGDFDNIWFYILAVVNGIALCLPRGKQPIYRLALFALRCVTMAYTFYFFVVFLPFLPFSILAILAVGAGFLMLTPMVLFVIHVGELSADFNFLRQHFSAIRLRVVGISCFLLIPLVITLVFVYHRHTLTSALDYLYSPDYSRTYHINSKSIQGTLRQIEANRNASRDAFGGHRVPYLTTYFNWLVLDNLSLAYAKSSLITDVFDNNITPITEVDTVTTTVATLPATPAQALSLRVVLSGLSATSRYDTLQQAWISQLDMQLTNRSMAAEWGGAEYYTTFVLPVGCWISNYYLYVGDRKEAGILAEKKTAMWVYASIRDQQQDPGILYYRTGNEVAFAVFPFAPNEVRRTGMELIHHDPVELAIDGKTIVLGNTNVPATHRTADIIETNNAYYLSGTAKQALPTVQRKPYYHFLVDRSYGAAAHTEELIRTIEQWVAQSHTTLEHAQISWVNAYTTTVPMDSNWQAALRSQPCQGGFFLERALSQALVYTYTHPSPYYPVPIVVSPGMSHAIIQKDFADLAFAFPESDRFYHLASNGTLMEHSLLSNPLEPIARVQAPALNHTVLAYPNSQAPLAYLPHNHQASIVPKSARVPLVQSEIHERDWHSGLLLQAQWMTHTLYPHLGKQEWRALVKYSFISHIMTPVTSYLAVENEAQKAILYRKQQEVLAGNKHYDLSNEAQSMSEPELLVLLALLVVAGGYSAYRRHKKQAVGQSK